MGNGLIFQDQKHIYMDTVHHSKAQPHEKPEPLAWQF